jgi:hypothetical protein
MSFGFMLEILAAAAQRRLVDTFILQYIACNVMNWHG